MGQALSFPSKSSSSSSSHERPGLAPETASHKKCATLSHQSLRLVQPFQASSSRRLQTDRDPNSDPARIRPMQITKSSLAQPGRIKSFQPNTIPPPPKAQTGSLNSSITSIPAGPSTSLPPLARNLPVSPALEKFRYRPPPEPTSDERSTDQASCAPQSPRKRIKIQPISEDTDITECKSYTGTAEPTARPPPLPPPPTLILLPEYDEFGEIVTPDPQSSQDHTRPDLLSQDCESNGQTFETDLSSSIELPSQLARRIRLGQSSTQPRPHSIHGRGSGFGTQPSDPDEVDCYDETDLGERETSEYLSRILEELEASGNLEADLAFSDDEKDELEAAVPVSAAEGTDDRSQEPPPSAPWGSPKPAPKAFGSEANDIAPFANHQKGSQVHADPCSSSALKFGTDLLDLVSSPSGPLRALSSEAAEDKVQRPSVEPRTPLGPRTSPPAPPKGNLIPAHPKRKCTSLDYLMAKHTPVPERPTHRLVPLTPEGLTTHLTRMLDSYRGETAATKALVESHQMIIDEQSDEIVRLRGELRRLEPTERRCENLTNRVEVLEQIRRGLLDMLEDKENECQALRSELECYRDKLESDEEKDAGQ
ncbi:BZ3500_MvSof-1268-A1-R1_Chr2-1g04132 [Microbotryum saponariae]|uniref:BZ3500_MvSof-1268-A1-R1_Chr2-1g04132 protein n=1 Tax=Microbotryum saponariae TaxID=289078 RepID=A0A2X0KDU0_9BASI|nr:BZ3500_MvSof-1268-A1-R1_Chr2-1g04132 [Microbotryum saponariae]SCZ91119.1 BZ3501_MvSof-1269-A2-R1_Chr2-1g03788 [Microbotryum saponariae]